jgi:hypothetical protein
MPRYWSRLEVENKRPALRFEGEFRTWSADPNDGPGAIYADVRADSEEQARALIRRHFPEGELTFCNEYSLDAEPQTGMHELTRLFPVR